MNVSRLRTIMHANKNTTEERRAVGMILEMCSFSWSFRVPKGCPNDPGLAKLFVYQASTREDADGIEAAVRNLGFFCVFDLGVAKSNAAETDDWFWRSGAKFGPR